MPEDQTIEAKKDGVEQPADKKTVETPFVFEDWLKAQTPELQTAYQAHTDGLLSALKSEREKRKELEKADKERAKKDEDSQKQRLTEQGEYKKLAEQADAKVKDLEAQVGKLQPLAERVAVLEASLQSYLNKEREGLPAHVLALLDTQPIEAQLAYIAKNRDALKAGPTTASGPTATPKPKGELGKMPEEEKRKLAFRVSL